MFALISETFDEMYSLDWKMVVLETQNWRLQCTAAEVGTILIIISIEVLRLFEDGAASDVNKNQ